MKRKTVTIQIEKSSIHALNSDDEETDETSRLISKIKSGNTRMYKQHAQTDDDSLNYKQKCDGDLITSSGSQGKAPASEQASITPQPTVLPRRFSAVFFPPDFDALFENPTEVHFSIAGDSIDEGIHSFDSGIGPLNTPEVKEEDKIEVVQRPSLPRGNSVMALSFSQILVKNCENSQGLEGFRHRMASDINHKYCSYCRCDDLIYIFIYVVFGIVYISAGTLGLTQCSSELYVNAFLITDGLLSVFIFPITIMEWTKRIGGCVKKEDVKGHGISFIVVVFLRLGAAVVGSAIIAVRINEYRSDQLMCLTVFTLLEVGVVIEWTFLLLGLLLPLLLYVVVYNIAKTL